MYYCMLRARDVILGNMWVEDVTIVPPTARHRGGVAVSIYLDKNRKKTTAGSWSFALSTDDELDAGSWLQKYVARMGWRLGKPPPRTPLFPRLTDGGAWTGAYDTNDHITRRMRGYMRDAGIVGANSYCLSGFRPGGHTDMLVATDGDHGVADALARWDTEAAERRYDRRDADAWLAKIQLAHFRGLRVGAEPGARAK
jgi:hypothetical protein